MKSQSLALASLLALAAVSASAQEATPWPEFDSFVSQKTRAEVKAELTRAQAEGFAVSGGEATLFADKPFVGSRDRAAVRAEARAPKARAAANDVTAELMYVGG